MAYMQETIARAKQHYEKLQQQGKTRREKSKPPGNPRVLEKSLIIREQALPGGWGQDVRLSRGESLRIVNEGKTAGVSVLLFNAMDPSERFNAGDTVKIQWSSKLEQGRLLLSDMGRVLASITDDSYGFHDALVGGSSKPTNIEKYGDAELRNTRDNFILLAAKHGLTKTDIHPCVTFFAPVVVTDRGSFQWSGPEPAAGDYVDLRAEMDLLIFVSNCPHPLAPGPYAPTNGGLIAWRSAQPEPDDYCRTSADEAQRAFENTEALFI